MSKLSFSPLYVAKLNNNGMFALGSSTVELANPVKTEIGGIPAAALTQLETDTQNLGKQINKNQKSALTESLTILDKERDDVDAEKNREIATAAKSSDPAKKAAAKALQLFLNPYRGLSTKPLDVETQIIAEMLVKYNASADLKAAAQKLGIDGLFTLLGTKNTAFDTLYKSRITESSEQEVSGTSLKPAVVDSYIQFCLAIEQAANFAPTDSIIVLFNKMDELRKKYHALERATKAKPVVDNTTIN